MRKDPGFVATVVLATVLLFRAGASTAGNLDGAWEGATSLPGMELGMRVEFRSTEAGLTATMDIPAQGAKALPLQKVSFEPPKVHFELMGGPGLAAWDGEIKGERIEGTFTQAGVAGTFRLERAGERAAASAATPATQPPAPPPASIEGAWEGPVSLPGMEIGHRVEFRKGESGLTGTVDFPSQGAKGLPLASVRYEPPKVHFELPGVPGNPVWDGEAHGDRIEGSYSQSGITAPFRLAKAGEAPPAKPSAPPPYREEEVSFRSGEVTLAGTLTLPAGEGKFPAVVLLTGSGSQTRDEEVFGMKPFLLLADALTRKGIAVLRFDDRGVGGSGGRETLAKATLEDYAGDGLAATAFLRSRAEIDGARLGFLGHSEGSTAALMAVTRTGGFAFVVLLAGPATTGERILLDQGQLILKVSGVPAEEMAKQAAFQKRVFEVVRKDAGWEELRAEIEKEALAQLQAAPEEQRKLIADPAAYAKTLADGQMAQVRSPWFRHFLDFDPASLLAKVQVPILALWGALDTQVPPDTNRDAMRKALEGAGHGDHALEILPGANHLFQAAKTGSPAEYALLPKEFVPGFTDRIADFILTRTAPGRKAR